MSFIELNENYVLKIPFCLSSKEKIEFLSLYIIFFLFNYSVKGNHIWSPVSVHLHPYY
jgi:hypothetical protein